MRGATISPASVSFCVTMPLTGATTVGVGACFLELRELRVDDRHARAGRVDVFAARAGLEPRHRFTSRADAIDGGAFPFPRHVHPRARVVALLLRSGVGLEQRLEPLKIGFGGASLGLGGRGLGGCRVDLRLRLADVLDARAGLEQAQLRVRRGALGLRPADLQVDVAHIELRDHDPGSDAVAFGDAQIDQPSADFRRDLHLGRLDVPGHANRVRRRLLLAAGEHGARRHDDATRDGCVTFSCLPPQQRARGPLHVPDEFVDLARGAAARPWTFFRCAATTRWRAKKIRMAGRMVR